MQELRVFNRTWILTRCILRRTCMVYCLQLLLLLTTRSSARTLSPCTCWPRCAVRWRWSSRSRRRWTSWTACSRGCSSAPPGLSPWRSWRRGPWKRAWEWEDGDLQNQLIGHLGDWLIVITLMELVLITCHSRHRQRWCRRSWWWRGAAEENKT